MVRFRAVSLCQKGASFARPRMQRWRLSESSSPTLPGGDRGPRKSDSSRPRRNSSDSGSGAVANVVSIAARLRRKPADFDRDCFVFRRGRQVRFPFRSGRRVLPVRRRRPQLRAIARARASAPPPGRTHACDSCSWARNGTGAARRRLARCSAGSRWTAPRGPSGSGSSSHPPGLWPDFLSSGGSSQGRSGIRSGRSSGSRSGPAGSTRSRGPAGIDFRPRSNARWLRAPRPRGPGRAWHSRRSPRDEFPRESPRSGHCGSGSSRRPALWRLAGAMRLPFPPARRRHRHRSGRSRHPRSASRQASPPIQANDRGRVPLRQGGYRPRDPGAPPVERSVAVQSFLRRLRKRGHRAGEEFSGIHLVLLEIEPGAGAVVTGRCLPRNRIGVRPAFASVPDRVAGRPARLPTAAPRNRKRSVG